MGFLDLLRARIAAHRARNAIAQLDHRALQDLGLSRSDLPAIRAGLIGGDASRRPRGAEAQS